MTSGSPRLPIRPGAGMVWRLAVVGVALGVLLSSSVGRDSCLRHGASSTESASIDVHHGHGVDSSHAACPLCTAAPIGARTCPVAVTTAPDAAIAVARIDLRVEQAPPVTDAPLDYAPKTSPPIA